ncbi:MAG: hypothetical protein ABIO60_12835 [Aquaticitalea sp.]
MKPLKYLSIFLFSLSLFTHCSSAQKLQTNAPMTFGKVEIQSWMAGVKGGGSGINLFIPVLKSSDQYIQLDSVYFRGKVAKLKLLNDQTSTYVGRFKGKFNQNEYQTKDPGNPMENSDQTLENNQKIPFNLKDNECVVSYIIGSETQYFKIDNVVEKPTLHFPSSPPNNH